MQQKTGNECLFAVISQSEKKVGDILWKVGLGSNLKLRSRSQMRERERWSFVPFHEFVTVRKEPQYCNLTTLWENYHILSHFHKVWVFLQDWNSSIYKSESFQKCFKCFKNARFKPLCKTTDKVPLANVQSGCCLMLCVFILNYLQFLENVLTLYMWGVRTQGEKSLDVRGQWPVMIILLTEIALLAWRSCTTQFTISLYREGRISNGELHSSTW